MFLLYSLVMYINKNKNENKNKNDKGLRIGLI